VKIGGTQFAPDIGDARRTLSIARDAEVDPFLVLPVDKLISEGEYIVERLVEIAHPLAAHKALEDEVKALKAELRTAERKKDELVEKAREKISREEARDEILKRFRRIVHDTYRHYLDADRRAVTAAIENLHDKYAVTLRDIEMQRATAVNELDGYLKALGYV
jgi:type I restriction enzyme M protein